MLRIALGIIVGLILGGLIFTGFQIINHLIFPFPNGMNLANPAEINKFVSDLPMAAFILVLAGYGVGSIAAGFLARKISRHASLAAPVILGFLFSIGWIINLRTLPHPLWVVVAGFFMYLPFTFLGHRLAAD